MTNKDQLQKEINEKVKPGVKPSDLKKKKSVKPVKPKVEKDDGYSSEEEEKIIPTAPTKKEKELQKQVNYWSNTAQNHLKNLQLATAKITNLELEVKEFKKQKSTKTQSELEKALQEANERIRILEQKKTADQEHILEKVKILEAENKKLVEKTIAKLENPTKNPAENKQKPFNCYNCKEKHNLSLLVIELPEGKLCKSCWQEFRKKTKEQSPQTTNPKPTTTNFTCHNCQENKQTKEYKVKLDATLQEYSICPSCLPLIKEYNEKEEDSNRELDIWE